MKIVPTCTLVLLVLCSVVFSTSQNSWAEKGSQIEVLDEDESGSEEELDDEILVSSVPKQPKSDEYNEDEEFTGIPSRKHSIPTRPRKTLQDNSYILEIVAGILMAIYLTNFLIGIQMNNKIAQRWFEAIRTDLEEQFSSVGMGNGEILHKESHSCFKLYASGRRYCHGFLATLNLKRRQDLYSLVFSLFGYSPSHDSVTIEVPINEEDMAHFVFCICQYKKEQSMRKSNADLENYAAVVKTKLLKESLILSTDTPELVPELLSDLVSRTINNNEDLFELLHFTDQGNVSFNSSNRVLRFRFRLSSDMTKVKALTRMSLFFIDKVATLKLPVIAEKRAISKRRQVADRLYRSQHGKRQEAISKKREEAQKTKMEKQAAAAAKQTAKQEQKQKASSGPARRNKVQMKHLVRKGEKE